LVTESQIVFFNKLLEEKEFGMDTAVLREQFSQLNKKSGSQWIEKALGLPKVDESKEETVPPPFGGPGF
jgi:hypothetical protein